MKSIITLGGEGTRLKKKTGDIPKPLFPICGKSPLERICAFLKENNIFESIWICGYRTDLFYDFSIRINDEYGLKITILEEQKPLGECGKLKNCNLIKNDKYLFLSGDLIFDIDLQKALDFHEFHQSDLTLFTHTSSHCNDSDCIIENKSKSIYKYDLKTDLKRNEGSYLGNAGIYIFEGYKFMQTINKLKYEKISFFKDVVTSYLKNKYRIYSYNTSEYIHDIGTVERFDKTVLDLSKNLIIKKSYKNKQKCLFLDRDGTLIDCKPGEYITKTKQLKFKLENIKKIASLSKQFTTVEIITNQPSISMSKLEEQNLFIINGILIKFCLELGLKIDCFRYCPHHPHDGFQEEIDYLKRSCFCRKPKPGLLLEAIYEKNISIQDSIMIGDSLADKKAAESIGIKFIDVRNL